MMGRMPRHAAGWASLLVGVAGLEVLLLASCVSSVSASQASPPAVLSGTLRDHVKGERFQVVSAIRGLPLGVRDELQRLFGNYTLDIADPGAAFQAGDEVANTKLPLRRLVAAGCSSDHCLVHYERGGSARSWVVALFHWTPAVTRLEWAGTSRGSLATIEGVLNAVVSGTLAGPVNMW